MKSRNLVHKYMQVTVVDYTDSFSLVAAATSTNRGGVAVFYPKAGHFAIEELCLHGPNVIIFQPMAGRRRWNILVCYIAPINASTIEDVEAVIRDRSYGSDILASVYLNANLENPEGTPQAESIVDELTETGIMGMGLRFPSRRKPWLK